MSDGFFDKLGAGRPTYQTNAVRADCAPQATYPPQPGQPAQISSMKRWSAASDVFRGAEETYDKLPAALYRTGVDNYGNPLLLKQKHDTDGLLELPDDASATILREFDTFWERNEAFRSRGFLHKRGFLLWGPPGSGKTSCVNILIKRLVTDRSGIVLFLDNPGVAAHVLRMVRMIEPERPMVCVMEDLDALVSNYGEHEYLSLLDGEAQVDRVAFVATTNYPERLDRRFCDRPSRFDTIQYIGMPMSDARMAYLRAKEPSLTEQELTEWTRLTDGFSLAHLKELIVAVKCLGQSFKAALDRLEVMRVQRPSSEDEPTRRGVGFVGKSNRKLYA
ncbi:MAG: AAA family ATPase [Betaproteobacteria bacterium]